MSDVQPTRIEAGGEVFLCARLPDPLNGASAVERVASALERDGQARPALLYWDAKVTGAKDRWVRWGKGGLDPMLAGDRDLSGCVAVSQTAVRRLVDRGAIGGEEELARAAALLSLSPGAARVEGLAGAIDLNRAGPLRNGSGAAFHAEPISIAILVDGRHTDVGPLFAALKGQVIAGTVDVVVLAVGLDSSGLAALARSIEASTAADPRLRTRRYSLTGQFSRAYLANVAMAMTTSETVVLIDACCVPVTPNAVQQLANWSLSGDAVAACPRVVHDGRLVAAGLALRTGGEGEDVVGLWDDDVLIDGARLTAAPSPWFFAARRAAWLAAGGLRETAESVLWTAEFALSRGPRGRSIMVGSETVEWIGAEPPAPREATTPVRRALQAYAKSALRDPGRPREAPRLTTVRVAPVVSAAPAARAGVAYSDSFPNYAGTRALVFADAFGASQSIAFVEGLAGARARGEAAVRILEEAAFPETEDLDDPSVAALVERHFEEVQPTAAVVSRMGRGPVWRAVKAAAHRHGVPVVFHIDDDLFDLPAILGIERYRLARNPRRLRTLRDGLAEADLVLAATPALARALAPMAGHDRIVALENGAAGQAPAERGAASTSGRLVIGYMGSASHDHDLEMIAPALNAMAEAYPHVEIALFGSIAEQPAGRRLRGRVTRYPPVLGDYRGFRRRLAELSFDIGLAPLRNLPFNRVKTPTKWVEYAEAGAAVLASRGEPYLDIVHAGAALDAGPDQWEMRLRRLIEEPRLRAELVARADALLAERFGWDRLEGQVLAALQGAATGARAAA